MKTYGGLFLAALSLICGASQAADAQPKEASDSGPIPARYFARAPTYQAMRLSPDGRYLAISARVGAEFSLLIVSLPGKTLLSGAKFANGTAVGNIFWESKERLVIELAHQEGDADAPAPTGELFTMEANGAGKRYLFGARGDTSYQLNSRLPSGAVAEAGFASVEDGTPDETGSLLATITQSTEGTADGRYYAFNFTPLYRLDARSGKKTQVAEAPMREPGRYFADRNGKVWLVTGVGDDSHEPVNFWRPGDGAWQPVPVKGARVEALHLARDGSRAFFLAAREGGTQCLVEWTFPVAGQQSPPRDLLCRPAAELADVSFTADDKPYAYASNPGGRQRILDEEQVEAQVLASLQEQFPDQVVYLASASWDHQRLMYRVYSDRNSGEYYLYDAQTKQAAYFDADQSWLDPERMATVQPLHYKARDGLDIDAFLTVPAGLAARNLPMVVLPHGGPIGAFDGWGWDADAQFLASRGYAVLQMNFRGSGSYGRDFERQGYGQWGGKMIDDITDGTRWAIEKGYADPKRIAILGTSYGGYAAIMSAEREPDLYRCAVGIAGVYDLNLLMKNSDVTNNKSGRLFWEESIAADKDERTRQSPVSLVSKLKVPVLIVHGGHDIRSPADQARALRRALDDQNKSYEWIFEPEEGHGFFNEDRRTELYEKIEAFLAKNTGVTH